MQAVRPPAATRIAATLADIRKPDLKGKFSSAAASRLN
jgi:hypothetical protein